MTPGKTSLRNGCFLLFVAVSGFLLEEKSPML